MVEDGCRGEERQMMLCHTQPLGMVSRQTSKVKCHDCMV